MRGFVTRDSAGSSLPQGFFRHGQGVSSRGEGPHDASPQVDASSREDVTSREDATSLAAVVAIPVRDEGLRIAFCLHALAVQIDAPRFGVVLVVDTCTDNTRAIIEAMRVALPFALRCVDVQFVGSRSNAAWARRVAMDAAAAWLAEGGCPDGLILTSDADGVVGSSWVAETVRAFRPEVSCVAGRVGVPEAGIRLLPSAMRRRLRRESVYEALLARIVGHYDPRPHDPAPRHLGLHAGSLAIRRSAYRRVGGLPTLVSGAAAALGDAIEAEGLLIRHVDTIVPTSVRPRPKPVDAAAAKLCPPALSPVMDVVRTAKARGELRRLLGGGRDVVDWASKNGLTAAAARKIAGQPHAEAAWTAACKAAPSLRPPRLPLADLPTEIALARKVVAAISAKELLLQGEAAPLFQDMSARIGRAIVGATDTWRLA